MIELAGSDPRGAILGAYEAVRAALRAGLVEAGLAIEDGDLDALDLAREAESRGIVPPAVTDAVLGLNVLHNLAKHAPSREMSTTRAHEYLAMADGALYAFSAALSKHLAPPLTVAA